MVRKASSKIKRRTGSGRGKAKQVCTKEDGICILPDEVLCHILSFLPTKDAVRASILSKRWKWFWTSLTSIDIEDNSFLSGDWRRHQTREVGDLFMDFVERVFRLNDVSCFQKISLNSDNYYDSSRISDLISTVFSRNVEVLDLHIYWEQLAKLPPSSLTCSKLVFLKLSHLHLSDIPTLVCLPSLKILHLIEVVLYHDDSMKILLEGCPVLQELDIKSSDYVTNMRTLFVQSSSLKSLRIDHELVFKYEVQVGIVIDTTNLEQLNLICDVSEQCASSNSLSSLIDLKLDCGYHDSDLKVCGNKLIRLLRKMSKTKYMCLYHEIMKNLEHAHLKNLPMFHNLVRMELHIYKHDGWQALPYLLKKSPNIRTFILLTMGSGSPCDEHEWHQQFRDPKCLLYHLEDIHFTGFKGCAEEMKMVRYFLKNAITLKKMSIQSYYSEFKDIEWEILKKLLILPRSSSSCEIAFN